jgi:hypothetical protein
METEWIAFLVHPRINHLRAVRFLSWKDPFLRVRVHSPVPFPPAVFVNSPYDNQGCS